MSLRLAELAQELKAPPSIFQNLSRVADGVLRTLIKIHFQTYIEQWMESAIVDIEPMYLKFLNEMPRAIIAGREAGWSKAKCGIRGAHIETQLKKDRVAVKDRADAAVEIVVAHLQGDRGKGDRKAHALGKACARILGDNAKLSLMKAVAVWSASAAVLWSVLLQQPKQRHITANPLRREW